MERGDGITPDLSSHVASAASALQQFKDLCKDTSNCSSPAASIRHGGRVLLAKSQLDSALSCASAAVGSLLLTRHHNHGAADSPSHSFKGQPQLAPLSVSALKEAIPPLRRSVAGSERAVGTITTDPLPKQHPPLLSPVKSTVSLRPRDTSKNVHFDGSPLVPLPLVSPPRKPRFVSLVLSPTAASDQNPSAGAATTDAAAAAAGSSTPSTMCSPMQRNRCGTTREEMVAAVKQELRQLGTEYMLLVQDLKRVDFSVQPPVLENNLRTLLSLVPAQLTNAEHMLAQVAQCSQAATEVCHVVRFLTCLFRF